VKVEIKPSPKSKHIKIEKQTAGIMLV